MAAAPGATGTEPLRKREPSAMDKARTDHAENILRYSFYQFLFFRQWNKITAYANEKGIKIIGDIPIFIAYDSADAWANPICSFWMMKVCQPSSPACHLIISRRRDSCGAIRSTAGASTKRPVTMVAQSLPFRAEPCGYRASRSFPRLCGLL